MQRLYVEIVHFLVRLVDFSLFSGGKGGFGRGKTHVILEIFREKYGKLGGCRWMRGLGGRDGIKCGADV